MITISNEMAFMWWHMISLMIFNCHAGNGLVHACVAKISDLTNLRDSSVNSNTHTPQDIMEQISGNGLLPYCTNFSWNITYLKLLPHLIGVNELLN